jgi:acyl carrier protein
MTSCRRWESPLASGSTVEKQMSNEAKVRAIIADQLKISEDQIKPEARFIEDLGADSLDLVELIMAMEDQFETSIPDDEAEKIRTVGDAIAYVNSSKKS